MQELNAGDTVELADELNTGEEVEVTVSFSTKLHSDERDTETHGFTVVDTRADELGAELKFKREGPHSTTHGRIDTRGRNTTDEQPAYLSTGKTTKKQGQDRQGRVEDVTRVTDNDESDEQDDAVDIDVGAEYDAMGETVKITNERDGRVCVHHPEREPVDGTAYTVWRPRESVEAVASREGWERLDTPDTDDYEPPGEWVDTPRCPMCGGFMSQDTDGMGLPVASCANETCQGWMDDQQLIEQGYFAE